MKKIQAIGIGIIALSLLACSIGLVTADEQGKGYTVIDAALSPVEGGDVHSVPQGSVIYHSADDITTVYAPDGKIVDNTDLSWSTGGNANWFRQTDTYKEEGPRSTSRLYLLHGKMNKIKIWLVPVILISIVKVVNTINKNFCCVAFLERGMG